MTINLLDKYYTSDNIAKKCIEYIKDNIKISNNDLCIEPSAGNGVFIKYIKDIFNNYIFYDIQPDNNNIIRKDFLKLNTNKILELKKNYNKIHIIGNPPFGIKSSLAIKFIKKSSEFSDTISFILPKSFKKNSLKKQIPLNFHLKFQYNIPNNSFIYNNNIYNVPSVFQIWIKKDYNRKISKILLPYKYKFVNKNEKPDISFRRIGVNAGKIETYIKDKSIQSHYFIKFNKELTVKQLKYLIKNKLSNIKYKNKNNTTGPFSISKQELIKEFNKIL